MSNQAQNSHTKDPRDTEIERLQTELENTRGKLKEAYLKIGELEEKIFPTY